MRSQGYQECAPLCVGLVLDSKILVACPSVDHRLAAPGVPMSPHVPRWVSTEGHIVETLSDQL
jgi:hypothetical protein